MRVLLDTHALLWWLLDDPQLSAGARTAIADPANQVFVSAVSGLEVATKWRLGKLWTGSLEPDSLPAVIAAQSFDTLPISLEHALLAGRLPGPHRDPFDRLLIAQSRLEAVPIVTVDGVFAVYDVEVLW